MAILEVTTVEEHNRRIEWGVAGHLAQLSQRERAILEQVLLAEADVAAGRVPGPDVLLEMASAVYERPSLAAFRVERLIDHAARRLGSQGVPPGDPRITRLAFALEEVRAVTQQI
jgi:hypothetical protein